MKEVIPTPPEPIKEAFGRGFVIHGHKAFESLVSLSEVASLLPSLGYLDLPDGGDVTVLEQLERMAADARRYQWLKENQLDNSVRSDGKFQLPDYGCLSFMWRRREWANGQPYVALEVDAAIDAAMQD